MTEYVDFYSKFETADVAYARMERGEKLDKKIDKAKNLLANNADVNEYPTGVYLIEPPEELIEILVEIGQLVHMNDSSSRRGTHKDALFVAGVEAVFRNRERTDGNSKYRYKVHLRNSSTYYFSLTPEKVKA